MTHNTCAAMPVTSHVYDHLSMVSEAQLRHQMFSNVSWPDIFCPCTCGFIMWPSWLSHHQLAHSSQIHHAWISISNNNIVEHRASGNRAAGLQAMYKPTTNFLIKCSLQDSLQDTYMSFWVTKWPWWFLIARTLLYLSALPCAKSRDHSLLNSQQSYYLLNYFWHSPGMDNFCSVPAEQNVQPHEQ